MSTHLRTGGGIVPAVAQLEHVGSGQLYMLLSRYVIGRTPPCHLLLENPRVSGLHAEVLWDGRRWVVQDLGSRNGTFVDGRRLGVGERALIDIGSELAFGVRDDRFRVVDVTSPRLMARSAVGELAVAEGDLLCLPSADEPEVTIFLDPLGGWRLESAEGLKNLRDGELVSTRNTAWTVHIPDVSHTTSEVGEDRRSLGDVTLEFSVSRDQEHVKCRLRFPHEAGLVELEPRAHNSLLLILAQARLSDGEQAALPASEHGWVHREDLLRMLRIDFSLLNVWVYRARQQWSEAGVNNSALLIERRAGSQQIRIGTPRISILTG